MTTLTTVLLPPSMFEPGSTTITFNSLLFASKSSGEDRYQSLKSAFHTAGDEGSKEIETFGSASSEMCDGLDMAQNHERAREVLTPNL